MKARAFPFIVIRYLGDERFPGDELYLPRFVFVRTDPAGTVQVSEDFLQIVKLWARA